MSENIELIKMPDNEKAKEYIRNLGFNTVREKWIPSPEGFEYLFIFEYEHMRDKNKVARIWDLRYVQRKVRPGEVLPVLFDFVQVAIKTEEAGQLIQ